MSRENPPFVLTLLSTAAFVTAMYFVTRGRLLHSVMSWLGMFVIISSFSPGVDVGKARKLTALSVATSIESAISNFKSVYHILPIEAERVQLKGEDGVRLLTVLLGYEKGDADPRNSKDICFLPIKQTRNRKGGIQAGEEPDSVEGLFDPWGRPYVVLMDAKGVGGLRFTYGSRTVDLRGKSVAVYSTGKDGVAGNADDVKTWGDG